MKRKQISVVILIPLITLACILIAYLAASPFNIPAYAEELYGPPEASLPFNERVYLTIFVVLHKKELTKSTLDQGTNIPFHVEFGESPLSVSARLHENGLIQDPKAFINFLRYSGLDTQIQAGDYLFVPGLTPVQIAKLLKDPTPQMIDFGILAGWRAEEIATSFPESGLGISPEEFLTHVEKHDLEGYLFPGLYKFQRNISTKEIVSKLTDAFNLSLSAEMMAGIERLDLSLHDAVILASIVEREAVIEEEMPLIASVFINRLNVGMKLDADPTVQYALGYNPSQETWWTNPLTTQDLEINSPYNTYIYPGLPPGPICNPGMNALKSIAFPAITPYYYFRASCDGSGRHTFAETFEEHIQNECP